MRLIDANYVDESLEFYAAAHSPVEGKKEKIIYDTLQSCRIILGNAPTIDAAPVVRGEWVVTDAYPHRVYCSLCYKTNVPNEEWLYEKNDYPKYCMWCGAKMEGKS